MHLRRRDTEGIEQGPSLAEVRRMRKAEVADSLRETRRILRAAGLRMAAVDRVLRMEPRVARLSPSTLRVRVDELMDILAEREIVASLVCAAPSLLLHVRLRETLPAKLTMIERETGIQASRVASLAPAQLTLDPTAVAARTRRLREVLQPELAFDADTWRGILRRTPRLLSYKPETLRARLDGLCRELPAEVEIADVVRRQPGLLGTDPAKVRAKLDLLRELCTADEWSLIMQSSSFARVLTTSAAVMERLRTIVPPSDGALRPVLRILLMTRRQWADRAGGVTAEESPAGTT